MFVNTEKGVGIELKRNQNARSDSENAQDIAMLTTPVAPLSLAPLLRLGLIRRSGYRRSLLVLSSSRGLCSLALELGGCRSLLCSLLNRIRLPNSLDDAHTATMRSPDTLVTMG